MTSITGSVTAELPVSADAAFRTITDIKDLPEWNARITEVKEAPAELTPGAEWLVRVHAMGRSWDSRSWLDDLDADKRVFAYKSGTDDGNPSRALWRWEVEETPNGSKVTCSWDLQPVTFWRRTLLVRMRAPSLAKEVNESIAALGKVAAAAA